MQVTKKIYLCAIVRDRYNSEKRAIESCVDYVVWPYAEYDGQSAIAEMDVTFELEEAPHAATLRAQALQKKRSMLVEFHQSAKKVEEEIAALLVEESHIGVDYDGRF